MSNSAPSCPGHSLGLVSFSVLGSNVKKLILLCSAAAVLPTAAFAQSTGSVDFEKETIVVTGTRTRTSAASRRPDTPKAKAVLTQEMISPPERRARRSSTRSTSSRASASRTTTPMARRAARSTSAASIRRPHQPDLRRHPAQRQRQLRHLLEPAARPGADRAGQRQPRLDRRRLADRLGCRRHRQLSHDDSDARTSAARVIASFGEFDFRRFFGMVDTGEFGPWGTRAFISASKADERQSVQQLRQDRQAAVQRQDLPADRRQRRLRLDRRPLQPEPQQFLRLAPAATGPDRGARPICVRALSARTRRTAIRAMVTSAFTTSISRARSTRRKPALPTCQEQPPGPALPPTIPTAILRPAEPSSTAATTRRTPAISAALRASRLPTASS